MDQQKPKKQIHWVEQENALSFLVIPPLEWVYPKKAILLLHGVGGNESNLLGFSDLLPDWLIICPRGPYTLSPGRYAWFDVDFSSGKPIINPAQEKESRKKLTDFLGQMQDTYSPDSLFIGGFSQGAIMSYSMGLTQPDKVKGVMAISGRILPEIKPFINPRLPALQDLKLFIGHGVLDNTLNITYARDALRYISTLGLQVEYKEFETGHQITPEILKVVTDWLNQ